MLLLCLLCLCHSRKEGYIQSSAGHIGAVSLAKVHNIVRLTV